ncbi:hypothetical protein CHINAEXTREME_05885 [Halobiforma lacisalsi AJ5]|uniref:Uncharacterized protein n=1 Tax=Natronobacterium lacisalsi AJ5 TaxID=358396 RepID=M0LJY6_NATLA|nr:hypothetical protein [Halobiforma lacisalsi]APW97330.1 hypothetical protein CHINAEXTREME_05885 [Halobiforma lacisalsi AJ5]EMA33846.1 hypothetical protein C445_09159 [Halobiforma lacisalsi AJ5]
MTSGGTRASILIVLAVLTVGIVAFGGSAAAVEDPCEGYEADERTVVAVVDGDDEAEDKEVTLHAGSTFDLVYCEGDEPATGEWLDTSDTTGFEADRDAGTVDGSYGITVTAPDGTETDRVAFPEYVETDEFEDRPDGVEVVIATSEYATNETFEGVDWVAGADGQYHFHERNYVTASENLTAAIAELNETITAIEDDGEFDRDDLEQANETLRELENRHEDMIDNETKLIDHLRSETADGNATGTFAAIEAIETERADRETALEAATENYGTAVEEKRAEPQSTVRLSLLGSLAGGLVVGTVAGAAVPLIAARRVEEKMKLSRDVSYDRKAALLPMLIGLLLAVAGIAVFAVVIDGGTQVLGVIG